MRVGIDARCLSGNVTGIGRYVREILLCLDALLPTARWVLYSRTPINMDWPSDRWQVVVDEHPVWRRLPGVLWVKWRLGRLAAQSRLDVFWAAGSLVPSVQVPVVTTVYDLNHLLVPETMTPINRFAYRRWFSRDVRAASQVVAISRGTAGRLSTLVGRDADCIAIPGSRWAIMGLERASARVVGEPYVLAVATREPRKNLASLVLAFAKLKSEGALPNHLLVLVGASGWGAALALPDGVDGWLRELGYVEDDLMASLFLHADLFVQPSFYEGFGLPAAEAASFGTRVVATDIPELHEAAGPNGVFVAPTVDGLAKGIVDAASMCRPEPFLGVSWMDSALVMMQALERATSPSGAP
jgi:glycosyltransferase involved in cell wall biosynthesis